MCLCVFVCVPCGIALSSHQDANGIKMKIESTILTHSTKWMTVPAAGAMTVKFAYQHTEHAVYEYAAPNR